MRPIVLSILVLTSGLASAQDVQPHPPARIEPVPETPPSLEAAAEPHLTTPACLETSVHRLKHISAADAARRIDAALREKHAIEPRVRGLVVESQVVVIPEPVSNSLIVAALPEFVAEVRDLVEQADRPPRQFTVEARMTRLDADGTRVLISRPQLRTTAGRPATVRIQDGEGRGYELEIVVEDAGRSEGEAAPGAATKTTAANSSGEAVPADAAEVIVKPKRHSADLTEEEIQQKLREKTSLHFESVPLNNAMRQVAQQAGINVVLDDLGLMERGVRPTRTVSVAASNLPLGEIVRSVLAPLGLDFRIEDEVLKITSRMRSRGPLETRMYPVADVATETQNGIPRVNLQPLVEKIEGEVHPDSWVHNGGPAVIRPFGNSLIVRQSQEGHELIENLLTSIRHDLAREPTKLDVRSARALLPPMLVPAQIEPVAATQPAPAEPWKPDPEQSEPAPRPAAETRSYAVADLTRQADGSHEIAWLVDELRPLCSAEEGICASVRADQTSSNLVVHGSAAIHAEVERRLEQIRRIRRHFAPEPAQD